MDPTMEKQLTAGWGFLVQGQLARGEQDHRVLGGVLTRMLLQAGDPGSYADLSTGARMPTTLEHPTYSSQNNPGVQK